MFGHGRCPVCKQDVSRCDREKITVGEGFAGPFFNAVAICCPNAQCRTVLSVIADPMSQVQDILPSGLPKMVVHF